MFVLDGRIITSPSDLTRAAECEFGFLRALDAKLGLAEAVPEAADPMRERAARLGDRHEEAWLQRYRASGLVIEVERPRGGRAAIEEAARQTVAAFAVEPDVVFQAAFFDAEAGFVGYADFVVRGEDGRYEVQDSKLARSAKVSALLQVAAYASQLRRLGIPVADTVRLLLGDGSQSVHELREIEPVYRHRLARLRELVDSRRNADRAIDWGAVGITACGRCEACEADVEASRDVLLVAGLRPTQRARLHEAGIFTIDELAASTLAVPGIADTSLTALRAQAVLQLRAGAGSPTPGAPLPLDFHHPAAVASLPEPNKGDLFFDFEGDPLYAGEMVGEHITWGLNYLFGMVDPSGEFQAFWAHDHAQEREALRDFLAMVRERRARHPGMRIYHYASYERTHLLSLAARHGVGEDEVDELLRENVLVDLYPVVRAALRVGSRSYSLKRIESLYLTSARSGEVTAAADSVQEYARYQGLVEAGALAEAAEVLASIEAYNADDCRSTLALRDWLLAQAARHGVFPGAASPREQDDAAPESPLAAELREAAGDPLDPDRTNDQRAYGMASAAVDYFRRENKVFWQSHFARLADPLEEWADVKDVLVVSTAHVVRDWHVEGRQRVTRRRLRLHGELAPGSRLASGGEPFVVYEPVGPDVGLRSAPGSRRAHDKVKIIEVAEDGSILIEENCAGPEAYDDLPIALTPPKPIRPGQQPTAISDWGSRVLAHHPQWPPDAVSSLLRRELPRTLGGPLAAAARGADGRPTDRGVIDALLDSLLRLDSSYLAVQGPPGTGKTFTGAHVIAALVREHGWKVGVVAQSHATVENLLREIQDAGVPLAAIGKKSRSGAKAGHGAAAPAWKTLGNGTEAAFLAEPGGRVMGGTAWTFSNPSQIPRGALDLLVIDEAGQFSLAATIAVGLATRNLLLLGDPQQLPQVSQGLHPEPVDGSALGHLSAGRAVLAPEFGYFLPQTRRMSPELTGVVSRLSYDGQLVAHQEEASDGSRQGRSLDGVRPGLHSIPVASSGNATESPHEAAVVVALVESLLQSPWTDPAAKRHGSPLGPADVIIVTPFNAQVLLLQHELRAAGLGAIRVGTVDRFQGQEAVVSIVSLAASSPADVPRGMPFLIMRNRLNVAISRAKWAAYMVHSPELPNYLPRTPEALSELSAFIRLIEQDAALSSSQEA